MDLRSSLTFSNVTSSSIYKPLVTALNDCEKPLADLFIIFGLSKSFLKSIFAIKYTIL